MAKRILAAIAMVLAVAGLAACAQANKLGEPFEADAFLAAYNQAAQQLDATTIPPEQLQEMGAYEADGAFVQVPGAFVVNEGVLQSGGMIIQPESIILIGIPQDAPMLLKEYTAVIMGCSGVSGKAAGAAVEELLRAVLAGEGGDASHTVELSGYRFTCQVSQSGQYSLAVVPVLS